MKCVKGDAEYRGIAIDGIELDTEYMQNQSRKD